MNSAGSRRSALPVPEIALLLGCASEAGIRRIHISSLASHVSDWQLLLAAADYHGLSPLVYRATEQECSHLIPPEIAARLRGAYQDSIRRGLLLSTRLLTLIGALQAEGISALPIKGPVLAEFLYDDPALRWYSDLDFLVKSQDVPRALHVFAREGYVREEHLAHLSDKALMGVSDEVLLRHPFAPSVDLHWGIAPRDYPFRFDADMLWRSVHSVRFHDMTVLALRPEILLLFLCVHGAKHLWSRLMWLGDVARLAQRIEDWSFVMRLAADTRCARPLLLGLLLARELLDARVPAGLVQHASDDAVIRAMTHEVAIRLRRIPPSEPESYEITSFNARLAERKRDKARHYAALLWTPTESEFKILTLPPALFWMYRPLRIARLTVKYARKLMPRR